MCKLRCKHGRQLGWMSRHTHRLLRWLPLWMKGFDFWPPRQWLISRKTSGYRNCTRFALDSHVGGYSTWGSMGQIPSILLVDYQIQTGRIGPFSTSKKWAECWGECLRRLRGALGGGELSRGARQRSEGGRFTLWRKMMDLYGFIWIYLNLFGFIWIYMDLLGCKWGAHGIISYNPWLSLIYGNLWSYKWHYKVGLSWDFLIG